MQAAVTPTAPQRFPTRRWRWPGSGYRGIWPEDRFRPRLSGGTADSLCDVVDVFTAGQIDLSGLVTSTRQGPGTFQIAVIGGTGSYTGARGYATVVSGQQPRVTIHLTG